MPLFLKHNQINSLSDVLFKLSLCEYTCTHARTHTSAVWRVCGGVGLSIRGFWRVVRVIMALGRGLPVCGCLLIRCGGGVASRCCVSSCCIICSRSPVASRCAIARRGIVVPRCSVVTSWRAVASWCTVCDWWRVSCRWRVSPWGCKGCGGGLSLCVGWWRWWRRRRRIGVRILEVLVLLLVLLILLVLVHLLVVLRVRSGLWVTDG